MNYTTTEFNECLICDIFTKIFAYYAIALIVVATLGNLFSSMISYRLGQKNKSTFKILSYVFFFNALTLYTWVLDIFLSIFNIRNDTSSRNIDSFNIIESLSIPTCKIFAFNQYFTLQTISWLLVFLLVDQIILLYLPKLKYNVKIVCLLIIFFFFVFNSHIIIFAGSINYKNVTVEKNDTFSIVELKQSVDCFHGVVYNFYKLWPIWDQIHLLVYSFVPFVIMMICNLVTIVKLVRFEKSLAADSSKIKKNKTSRKLAMVLLVTNICFMICSLPEIVLFTYYFEYMSSNRHRFLLLPASDLLHFTYIGFSFLIYLLKNKLFRFEFLYFFYHIKIRMCLKKHDFLYFMNVISEEEYFTTQAHYLIKLNRKHYHKKLNERNLRVSNKNEANYISNKSSQ